MQTHAHLKRSTDAGVYTSEYRKPFVPKVRVVNDRAESIVAAIAATAAELACARDPTRWPVAESIARRTGYAPSVVAYALDRLFASLTRRALFATIANEVGSPVALDEFVARPGRPDAWYRGVPRAALVASDTTIGVVLPALVFALCAKVGRIVVKDRDDGLVAAFVAALARRMPHVAARVDVTAWDGHDAIAVRAHVGDVDVAIAYGGDDALVAIRNALPARARFVGFGHRTSVGYVAREALASAPAARALAIGIAHDALLYDGDGCLSVHLAFVERGGAIEPRAFAAQVATACDETARALPASDRARDARVAAYVRSARFRASQAAGAIFARDADAHVVAYDERPDDAPPLLPRVLALAAVDGPEDARAYLARHALPLEAFARAADDARDDIEELARASGATRFAAFGTLQDPPLAGDHGGEGRILPFVRAIYRA